MENVTAEREGIAPDDRAWHSSESSLREKIIEHSFIAELLRCLWQQDCRSVEVLKAEVDRGGYDLVIEANGHTRHIQLKSSYLGAKTADVDVHLNLLRKPSGCVIWVLFDPATLQLGQFLWLGSRAGSPLMDIGEKVARHSKGDSNGNKCSRLNHRTVGKGRFRLLPSVQDLAQVLFDLVSAAKS